MTEAVRLETTSFRPIPMPDAIDAETIDMRARARYWGRGFEVTQLPETLRGRITEQFEASVPRFRPEPAIDHIQTSDAGTIPALYFEDPAFNRWVLEAMRPLHEAWSGLELLPSACYGIRVYQRGSYLHNHVDRTKTHIISSTLCIDGRLETPWPLYIEDIHGQAYVVDMQPGDCVFYEGASLVHGRPWPLRGDWYAGMFVHYRPRAVELEA